MATESFKIELENKFNDAIDDDFKIFMYQEFYKTMLPYIPFYTGCLSSTLDENEYPIKTPYLVGDDFVTNIAFNSGNIDETGILFNARHAEDCYYSTGNFKPDVHPLATSNWADIAFNAHKDELENTLTEYLERKTKND